METALVRLKRHDPRRGFLLRRFTYQGIKFQGERGWYRVEKHVADYLKGVRQVATDPHSPPAFDVCTEEEAKRMEAEEAAAKAARATSAESIKLTPTRDSGTLSTDDLPESSDQKGRKPRKG